MRVAVSSGELAPADLLVGEREGQERVPPGGELADRRRWPLWPSAGVPITYVVCRFNLQLLLARRRARVCPTVSVMHLHTSTTGTANCMPFSVQPQECI